MTKAQAQRLASAKREARRIARHNGHHSPSKWYSATRDDTVAYLDCTKTLCSKRVYVSSDEPPRISIWGTAIEFTCQLGYQRP